MATNIDTGLTVQDAIAADHSPHVFTMSNGDLVAVYYNGTNLVWRSKSGGSWSSATTITLDTGVTPPKLSYLTRNGDTLFANVSTDPIDASHNADWFELTYNTSTHTLAQTAKQLDAGDGNEKAAGISYISGATANNQVQHLHGAANGGFGTIQQINVNPTIVGTDIATNFTDFRQSAKTGLISDGSSTTYLLYAHAATGTAFKVERVVTSGTTTTAETPPAPAATPVGITAVWDGTNFVFIINENGAKLRYLTRTGSNTYGSWTDILSDASLVGEPAVCVKASTGDLVLFYRTNKNQANGEIWSVARTGGTWGSPALLAGGASTGWSNPSCAASDLNDTGVARVVYVTGTSSTWTLVEDSFTFAGGSSTITRQVPASAALQSTITRQVPSSAALVATNKRTVPTSAALLQTNTRAVPSSAALLATIARTVPASGALFKTNTRLVPASASLSGALVRQVPASAALSLTTKRAVPASAALYDGSAIMPPPFMPRISLNAPAFGSTNTFAWSRANNSTYGDFWRSGDGAGGGVPSVGTPVWLAYDLSAVASGSRGLVVVNLLNEQGNLYYNTDTSQATSLFADYKLQGNAAATNPTNAPSSGWVDLVSVTGNLYPTRQHIIDLTGYNWLRFICTASNGSAIAGNNDVSIQMDVHDAHLAGGSSAPIPLYDAWLFLGDSITLEGQLHPLLGGGDWGYGGSLANIINSDTSGRWFPATIDGGNGGMNMSWAATNIAGLLNGFHNGFVSIAFGTNDGNSAGFDWSPGDANVQAVYANLKTCINAALALSNVVVVPKVPDSGPDSPFAGFNGNLINQYVAANLPTDYGSLFGKSVFIGPDFWTFFHNNQNLIRTDNGPIQIHPTYTEVGGAASGYEQMHLLWAQWMLQNIYLSGITRTVPASAALSATVVRSTPASVALSATITRQVPSSAALLATRSRTIHASAALFDSTSIVKGSVTIADQRAATVNLGDVRAGSVALGDS